MENGGFNVKEYFISEIDIDKLYHLSDIKIQLGFDETPASSADRKKWFRKDIVVVRDRKIFEGHK